MGLALDRTSAEKSTLRNLQLDGVRGIAILLILICHYGASKMGPQPSPFADSIVRALGVTISGVDLFFVLSGFLIGGILLDNKESPHYFKTFYLRRACRIFPLYFAWLLLFIIIYGSDSALIQTTPLRELFVNPLPIWSYATFTQNIAMAVRGDMGPHWLGITWSLAVEEQFYLTLPFIIRLVSYRKLSYVVITVIAAVPILRGALLFVPPHSLLPGYVLMLSRADALFLGVFVAYAMRRKEIAQYLANHIRWLYGAFVLLLFGAIVLAAADPNSTGFIAHAFGFSEIALLYACFLLLVLIEKRGLVVSVTMNHLLRSLGVIAYGVYLFHEAINYLAHGLILGQSPQLQTGIDLLVSLAALCFTILIAEASWSLFEKRFVAIGHSFRYENSATPDATG